MESFSVWVRRLRTHKGLTQDLLAEQVGCATATIRKIEAGERRPSFQMTARLADILGVPEDQRAAFMELARSSASTSVAPEQPEQRPAEKPRPSTLPSYFTPFLGREREVQELRQWLMSDTHRLITLLGVGGVGKTRLAIEVAHELSGFRDGIIFVPLATLTHPDGLLSTIATALDFHFSGTLKPEAQLLSFLADKNLLLILDTVEHLLTPNPGLVDLLVQIIQQAAGIKLLLTSRERIKLQAEWVMEVQGLSVDVSHRPGQIAQSPAAQLFFAHAKRIRHNYVPVAADAATVAEICQFIDGLPLGLELAAAWIAILSPQEISEELQRTLSHEPIAPQDFPERHHSLAAVFRHSWQLLTNPERQTLQALAVFRGKFSRAAAVVVADASLSILLNLVDKSLLRRLQDGSYELHPLIRQYALEQLQRYPDKLALICQRHCEYYCSLLQHPEQLLTENSSQTALGVLVQHIDNLRAAWDYAIRSTKQEAILAMVRGLVLIYDQQAWLQEGHIFFEQAAISVQRAGLQQDAALGVLIGYQGYFTFFNNPAYAASLIEQGMRLLVAAGEQAEQAFLLVQLGHVAHAQAQFALSAEHMTRAYQLAQACGDHLSQVGAVCGLAILDIYHARLIEAEQKLRACITNQSIQAYVRWEATAYSWLSATLRQQGHTAQAEEYARKAMHISSTSHHTPGIARALYELGILAFVRGDSDSAQYLLNESCAAFQSIGRPWMYGRSRAALIGIQIQQGQREQARQGCGELLTLIAGGALVLLAEATLSVARLLQVEQRQHEALALLDAFEEQAGEYDTIARLIQLREALVHELPPESSNIRGQAMRAEQLIELLNQLLVYSDVRTH